METKWRKINGGETVEAPCWLTDGKKVTRIDVAFMWPIPGMWTHWRPAEPTPEPPREPSHDEMDEKAYIQFVEHNHRPAFSGVPESGLTPSMAWRAALAYERAEIAKLLPNCSRDYELTRVESAIDAIRARCNGGSSK